MTQSDSRQPCCCWGTAHMQRSVCLAIQLGLQDGLMLGREKICREQRHVPALRFITWVGHGLQYCFFHWAVTLMQEFILWIKYEWRRTTWTLFLPISAPLQSSTACTDHARSVRAATYSPSDLPNQLETAFPPKQEKDRRTVPQISPSSWCLTLGIGSNLPFSLPGWSRFCSHTVHWETEEQGLQKKEKLPTRSVFQCCLLVSARFFSLCGTYYVSQHRNRSEVLK